MAVSVSWGSFEGVQGSFKSLFGLIYGRFEVTMLEKGFRGP